MSSERRRDRERDLSRSEQLPHVLRSSSRLIHSSATRLFSPFRPNVYSVQQPLSPASPTPLPPHPRPPPPWPPTLQNPPTRRPQSIFSHIPLSPILPSSTAASIPRQSPTRLTTPTPLSPTATTTLRRRTVLRRRRLRTSCSRRHRQAWCMLILPLPPDKVRRGATYFSRQVADVATGFPPYPPPMQPAPPPVRQKRKQVKMAVSYWYLSLLVGTSFQIVGLAFW